MNDSSPEMNNSERDFESEFWLRTIQEQIPDLALRSKQFKVELQTGNPILICSTMNSKAGIGF